MIDQMLDGQKDCQKGVYSPPDDPKLKEHYDIGYGLEQQFKTILGGKPEVKHESSGAS